MESSSAIDLGGGVTSAMPDLDDLLAENHSNSDNASGQQGGTVSDLIVVNPVPSVVPNPAPSEAPYPKPSGAVSPSEPVPSSQPSSRTLNVRDFGAVGDGKTDDTTSIQAALDNAGPGETVYFPGGIYITSKTLFLSTDFVTVSGYNAHIRNETNSRAILAVYGGKQGKLSTDEQLRQLSITGNWGEEVVGVRILGLSGEMQRNNAGGANVGFLLSWARDCELKDVAITSSNGNAFQVEHGLRCRIVKCSGQGHKFYAALIFQSSECEISQSFFRGGMRGIVFKHNYDGERACNHTASQNTLVDIEQNGYWIVGGEWLEVESKDEIYRPGHEVVRGVNIYDNQLKVENGRVPPGITVGAFADGWNVSRNVFSGSGLSGYAVSVGNIGNWNIGGQTGGGHLFEANEFTDYNAVGNTTVSIHTEVAFRRNTITGTALQAISAKSSPRGSITSLDVSGNNISVNVPMRFVGETGVTVGRVVDQLTLSDNILNLVAISSAGYSHVSALFSDAKRSSIMNNSISLKRGVGARAPISYGAFIAGGSGEFSTNTLNVDAEDAVFGVQVNAPGFNLTGNKVECALESTASRRYGLNGSVVFNSVSNEVINF